MRGTTSRHILCTKSQTSVQLICVSNFPEDILILIEINVKFQPHLIEIKEHIQ